MWRRRFLSGKLLVEVAVMMLFAPPRQKAKSWRLETVLRRQAVKESGKGLGKA